jgi:hypothetical protein
MTAIEEKLDEILQDLDLIKNHLKIVPDKDSEITDMKSSISEYERFAKEELHLNEKTITNKLSILSRFLHHSKGVINKESVRSYLDANDSGFWKSNQLKALRKYIREYLKLGNWINEFEFSKTTAKIKQLPTDQELLSFAKELGRITDCFSLVVLLWLENRRGYKAQSRKLEFPNQFH